MNNKKLLILSGIFLILASSCATSGTNTQATTIAEQNTKIAELSDVTPGAQLDATQSNTPEPIGTDIADQTAAAETIISLLTQSTEDLMRRSRYGSVLSTLLTTVVAAGVLVFGHDAKGKGLTFRGEVVDLQCYTVHPEDGQGLEHAKCAKACIN